MIKIDTKEEFQHLRKAPIAEAVVDIRSQPSTPIEEVALREYSRKHLTNYEFLDTQRSLELVAKVNQGPDKGATIEDVGWNSDRFKSKDGKQILQINTKGIVFSRLPPYTNWEHFSSEAMACWRFFSEFAKPEKIHRIGLRFINRIELHGEAVDFRDFLLASPAPPKDFALPFLGFLHQEFFGVPDQPYAINLIKTVQGRTPQTPPAIIVDIDVFTKDDTQIDEERIPELLNEMRWLKNKVFFGSVTEQTRNLYS